MSMQLIIIKADERLPFCLTDKLTIGREGDLRVDIDLSPDCTVSRQHAQLVLIDQDIWLEDLGSNCGTILNDRDIRLVGKHKVWNRDKIQVGNTFLEIRLSETNGQLSTTSLGGSELKQRKSEARDWSGVDSSEYRGRRIGPYRLERELGSGGMGVVYLAVRDDAELRMNVAVKLIKPQAVSPVVLERFRRERQLLADLKHPHIAVLLDAGATEDGLPYFIMEYVEGTTIVQWCQAKKPGLIDRLHLFRKVLDAVAYAHRKDVIHRDIKPANVLVTLDDIPKLLDFGIASLAAAGENETLTGQGQPMTPAYAAPEQFFGEAATPRFDIYALGALLLEMILGNTAQHMGRKRLKILQTIMEGGQPFDKNGNPLDLDSTFSPELGKILMTALAEEPHRRYGSCDQFIREIDRLLAGKPLFEEDETQLPD